MADSSAQENVSAGPSGKDNAVVPPKVIEEIEEYLRVSVTQLDGLKGRKDDEQVTKEEIKQIARLLLLAFSSNSFILSRVFPETKNFAKILEDKIMEVREYLGKELVDVPYFSRGVLEIPLGPEGETYSIVTRQYYELVPYYGPPREPKPNEVTKLYQWLVIDGSKEQLAEKQAITTFELEKSIQLFDDKPAPYVIGTSSPGMHASLQFLDGGVVPPFEQIEEFIMDRLIEDLVPEDRRKSMKAHYAKHAALNLIKKLPKGPDQPCLDALSNYLTETLSCES